ncbi:hypothetical protein K525DRAFT_211405 [Schizophyllum commune Loenen D]|nr:hypothetical protein K525DRAFT_211405 [Schizophyllum commune Loenen D]
MDDILSTGKPKAAEGASVPPSSTQQREQSGLAHVLTCPADAPEWVSANFEVFAGSDVDLGPKHRAALEKWLKLEQKWGYDANKGTTSKGAATRPDVLDKWIRNGRAPRTKKIPAIADIAAFEKEVWRWWGGMQPEWRNMEADGRPSVDREVELAADWGLLSVHGQNGMLNAVALASWWGVALGGRASRSWQRFLDEVIWVCEEQAN